MPQVITRINSTSVTFRDESGDDFRLAMDDTAAKGAGVNLYNDENLSVTTDIENESRPSPESYNLKADSYAFDIGADQISGIEHNNYSMSLYNDSAKITSSDDPFSTYGDDIPSNRWTHISYTRDSVDQYLFINGTQRETSSIDNFLFANNGKLYIGAQDDISKNSFQGFIDEVRIYNYARSESEIRKDRAAGSSGRAVSRANEGVAATFGGGADNFMSDGLIAYYKLDETTGTTVTDHSGNSNNGTLTNAQEAGTAETVSSTTTIVDADNTDLSTTDDVYVGMIVEITGGSCGITTGTTRIIDDYTGSTKTIRVPTAFGSETDGCTFLIDHQVGGKFGNDINFDDDNDYVVTNEALDYDDRISVAAWVKIDTRDSTRYLLQDSYNGWRGFRLRAQTGSNLFNFAIGTPDAYEDIYSTTQTETDTWYHLVGTYDGNEVKLYVNGESDSDPVSYNGTIGDHDPLYIGSAYSGSSVTDGNIDEVRIYNRAISANEVKALYKWAPGPVAHWKMDEKVAGDAQTLNDSSGNDFAATTEWGAGASGMDCTKPGKYGFGCEFDGTDDYASVADPGADSIFDFDSGEEITMSMWIYNDNSKTTLQAPFAKGNNANWGTEVVSGGAGAARNFRFFYYGISGWQAFTTSSTPFISNNWHHATVTHSFTDPSSVKMYVDGVVLSGTWDYGDGTEPPTVSNENLFIGRYGGGEYYDGLLDDVKLYNYTRTQDQIIEDMNAGHPAGGSPVGSPIAYWKFNEGYGDTAHEEISGDDGTLDAYTGGTNTTETAMWALNGKFDKAIEFDGTDDRVEISDPGTDSKFDFDNGDSMTISAWINPEALNDYGAIVSKGAVNETDDANYQFQVTDGSSYQSRLSFWYYDGTGGGSDWHGIRNDTDVLQTGQWQHVLVALTFGDPDSYKFFHNGVEYGTQISEGDMEDAPVQSNEDLWVGASNETGSDTDYSAEFEGLIDEVKIYNYAMSAAQAKTEFNQGKAQVMGEDLGRDNDGTTVTGANKEYCIPGDTEPCDPPVGEWKLDELSGTTAYDTSGNGNDGTIDGATWDPLGKVSNALSFDGSDDYIELDAPLGGPTSLSICDSDHTISAWLRSPDLATKRQIYAESDGGSSFVNIDLHLTTTGTLNYHLGINGDPWVVNVETASSFDDDQFHYVTATRDTNTYTVYVDGVYQNSTTIANDPWCTEDAIDIGREVTTGGDAGYFNGLIDEFRLFDYARTPAQIAWDFNRGGPIAEWRFDENSGTTVHDESGNGNDGTMTNMDAGTDWVDGKYGKALDFDGSDDYVDVGEISTLKPSEFVTLSFWMFTNSSDNSSGTTEVVGYWTGSQPSYGIRIETDEGITYETDTDSDCEGSYTHTTWDKWQHFTLVYDGSACKLYLDGLEVSETPGSGDISYDDNAPDAVQIGADTTERYFKGKVDDVKIWGYPLTAEQVMNEYNQGAAVSFQ